MSRRLGWGSGALLIAALMTATLSAVQMRQRRGFSDPALAVPTPDSFDGAFNFCRVVFRSGRLGGGGGWSVDYPRADVNLSVRLSELTTARISVDAAKAPRHFLVHLTDEALFQCPFIMMTEVGGLFLNETEASHLRNFLVKGGFLWADDFWGSAAWYGWETEIRKVLPAADYPLVDLPLDHPLFRTHFEVSRVPQIPSINFWAGTGGATSERGIDSAEPHARAITDARGRVLVLMTHNTDIGDSWEREADDPAYFYEFAVDGYSLGINVLLYAMTH